MGNHDDSALGTLANRPYVAEWSAGHRKIYSVSASDAVAMAALTSRREAGPEDVAGLLGAVARRSDTRRVTADEKRVPFTGAEYVTALRSARFTGAGPLGHGYGPEADGSIGTAQLRWLEQRLTTAKDAYVVEFSHHPSTSMENLAPDPRSPHERRHTGKKLLEVLHRHPNVVAWVNGRATSPASTARSPTTT